MTTILAIAVAMAPGFAAPAAQGDGASAASILTKMFARYGDAKTLKGTIVLTQSIGNQGGQLKTDIQFEYPSKLYLRQEKEFVKKETWLVTSDGKHFSYAAPYGPGKGQRLIEPIRLATGTTLTVRDIYAAVTASIGDRSAPLDLAISRKEDLNYLRGQWASLTLDGAKDLNGEEVYAISGNWREYQTAPVSGRFQIFVSKEGDLKRYAIEESVKLDNSYRVVSVWEVNLKINGEVDDKLFKLVK